MTADTRTARLPRLAYEPPRAADPVPRTLHLVWLGSKPPAAVRQCWEAWSAATRPDAWTIRRWTDGATAQDPLAARVVEWADGHGLSERATADVVRLAVVYAYGGVYMDSDAYPVRDTGTLAGPDVGAWIGERPADVQPRGRLSNAFFGMPARHPFLVDVMNSARAAVDRGITDDHHIAGPAAFYREHTTTHHYLPIDRRFLAGPSTTGEVSRQRARPGTAWDVERARAAYPPPTVVVHP